MKRLLSLFVAVAFLVGPLGSTLRPALASDAASLSGVVRDDQGEALPGSRVALVGPSGETAGGDTADEAGRYAIDIVPGRHDLQATAERNGRRYVGHLRGVEVSGPRTLDLVLIRPGVSSGTDSESPVFSGTLRDGDGVPFGGVVTLYAPHRIETTIGVDGTFRLSAPARTYRLEVSPQRAGLWSLSFEVEGFALEDDRHEELVVPFTDLVVSIRDERGAPLGGGSVELQSSGEDCFRCEAGFELFPGAATKVHYLASASSDESGRAVLRALPGRAAISVNPPSFAFEGAKKEVSVPVGGGEVEIVLADAPPPPPMVRWQGELVDPVGDDINIKLSRDDEHIATVEPDEDGRFTVSVPAGHYEVRLSAVVDTYLGGFKSGDDGTPGLFVTLPDFDLTADRTQDLSYPVSQFPVTVVDRDGAPVVGERVSGDSEGPVELFPGAVGTGLLSNNPRTDQSGIARLLIFSGVTPSVVSAGLYDITGQTTPAPHAASALIRTDAPVLRGTLRDARGVLPEASLADAWVAFHDDPFSGQFAPWPFFVGPDARFDLQALAGQKTLHVSNDSVWSDQRDERRATATLPAAWHFVVDYHHDHDVTIDLTIPDAVPAVVIVADPFGRPVDGTLSYAATVDSVELAPGFEAESHMSGDADRDGGHYLLPLFGSADVRGRFGPGVDFRLPLRPGDEAAVLLAHWEDSPPIEPPIPPVTIDPVPQPDGSAPGPRSVSGDQAKRSGYWMVGSDGSVYAFGDAHHLGNAPIGQAVAVDLEPTPSGNGYWVIDDRGHVFAFGDALGEGNVERSHLVAGEMVTSLSSTPTGAGYWVFTTKGRVLTFGDAQHFGDMSATALNGPVLDSIPTPSGKGYYMVASDGGIFAFGDARFAGSMGGQPLNAPVQSLVPDGDGSGYWLVASDGGVFAFDSGFRGSMGDQPLNRPVTGMVPFGSGYLMVGEDGGIFNFSDREFLGSLGSNPPSQPITSVAVLNEG